jgi:hypothetical protein
MVVYLIFQFLAVYFSYKIWGKRMHEKLAEYNNNIDIWVETYEFWYIVLVSLFWIVIVPCAIAWYLLDTLLAYIFRKINNKLNK